MGLFDALNDWSDESLWLFGLTVATLVFLSLGSAGLGTGGYFQGWAVFLDVFKAVIGIQVIFGILSLLFGLFGLLGPILVALLGAYVASRLFGTGTTASSMENALGNLSHINPIAIVVFLVLIVLLV